MRRREIARRHYLKHRDKYLAISKDRYLKIKSDPLLWEKRREYNRIYHKRRLENAKT